VTSPWSWSPNARRYRNAKTGRFIGAAQMATLRDQFIIHQRDQMQAIADRVARDAITRRDMVLQAREVIKGTTLDCYALAKGGRGHMTQSDYGKVGAMVKAQYQYLQQLEQRLKDGKLSAAQLAYQLKAYVTATKTAFEAGKVASYGVPSLPAYPGQGSECLYNCKCRWNIVDTPDAWECTWTLSAAEHCPTCLRRAAEWNPLRVPKSVARYRADLDAALYAIAKGSL
jgi:hypothetical protein